MEEFLPSLGRKGSNKRAGCALVLEVLKRQVLKQYGENYHLWPQGRKKKNQRYLESNWNFWSNLSLMLQMPKQWPLFMHSSKDLIASEGTFGVRVLLILLAAEIRSHE